MIRFVYCLPVLLFELSLLQIPLSAANPEVLVTIEGAFRWTDANGDTSVYMFYGGQYQVINTKTYTNLNYMKDNSEIRFPKTIKSAVMKDSSTVIVYGKTGGQMFRFLENGPIKKFRYKSKGGPDAAATMGGVMYLFYGCRIITVKNGKWVDNVEATKYIFNLPCDVDAAWAHGTGIVVLKGDQYWRLLENKDYFGPFDAQTDFPLALGWKYKPSS